MIIPIDFYPGKIFTTNNFGKLQIIKYVNAHEVHVVFINTGFITTGRTSNIRKGFMRDPYHPFLANIGFTGEGKYKNTRHGKYKKIYSIWSSMLKRCYSTKTHINNPTYKKCTVIPLWHNFQNFAKWFEQNYIEGYELDKDIIKTGNKEYGPNTCLFVPRIQNIQKAKACFFTLISPTGKKHEIYNLEAFCRNHKLHSASLRQVRSGKRTHTKGWKLYEYGTK